jgi:hypothetical protein
VVSLRAAALRHRHLQRQRQPVNNFTHAHACGNRHSQTRGETPTAVAFRIPHKAAVKAVASY